MSLTVSSWNRWFEGHAWASGCSDQMFLPFPCFFISPRIVQIYSRGLEQANRHLASIFPQASYSFRTGTLLRVTLSTIYVSGLHLECILKKQPRSILMYTHFQTCVVKALKHPEIQCAGQVVDWKQRQREGKGAWQAANKFAQETSEIT